MSMQDGEGEYRVVLTRGDGLEARFGDAGDYGTWVFDSPASREAAREAALARAWKLQDETVPDDEPARFRILRVEARVEWDAWWERDKAGRSARTSESIRYPSMCIAHRCQVFWRPAPVWWYHAPVATQRAAETRRCTAMWSARAPEGRLEESSDET